MDNRNLEKALEIFSCLITGEEVSRKNKDTASMYEEYTDNSQVYDMVTMMCRKMNLSLFEYKDTIYLSPGNGNRVFGYTNEELKREIGIRVNRELYLCYFIMFSVITSFYADTASASFTEYIKSEDIINDVDNMLSSTVKNINILSLDEIEENSFQAIAALWEELPLIISGENATVKAARGTKAGFVKMVFNFMEKHSLLMENEGRYYPTDRLRALTENYFEKNKGRLYDIMKGAAEDASYQQNKGE